MTSADDITVWDGYGWCYSVHDDNDGEALWAGPTRRSGATAADKALAYRVRDAIRARIDDYNTAADTDDRNAVFEFIDDVVSGLESAGREA